MDGAESGHRVHGVHGRPFVREHVLQSFSICPRTPGRLSAMASPVCSTRTARASTARRATAAGSVHRLTREGRRRRARTTRIARRGSSAIFRRTRARRRRPPRPATRQPEPRARARRVATWAPGSSRHVRHCEPLEFVPVGASCTFDVMSVVSPIASSLDSGSFDVRRAICAANAMCAGGACQQGPAEGDPCVSGGCGASYILSCVGGTCTSAPYAVAQCAVAP